MIKLLSVVSFSEPWGLGCAEYQYEQQWLVGLAYDRAGSRAVISQKGLIQQLYQHSHSVT
jgi:hypothetical protein